MKIPFSWLREHLPLDEGVQAVSDRLTLGGLEVEEVHAPLVLDHVVVGEILEIAAHPNADRLRVCQVRTGPGEIRTIVCGAPNAAAGLRVPCALPGAQLPGGLTIRTASVRGVESSGMLCSAHELGLAEASAGLLVLEGMPVAGQPIAAALGRDEAVIEIKTTPNRGDCLGVAGVARDLAALAAVDHQPLAWPAVAPTGAAAQAVDLQAPDLCGRFARRVLRGVNARAQTPDWMRRRLEQAGQRSVSALVDISNFVMLESGQPSHVFDLSALEGGLTVRWARAGERLALLNGQEIELDPWFGVVADARGPQALAGIMGGAASAVNLDTRDVLLEAAFWHPLAIQGRARRLGLPSEAAHRFERGVDFALPVPVLERLTALIAEVCGGPGLEIGPLECQDSVLPQRQQVSLRLARLERLLGVAVASQEASDILASLGLAPVERDGVLHCQAPSWRFDIAIEEDLVEEVARVRGFDRLPAEPPLAPAAMRAPAEASRSVHALRDRLASSGFQELVNFSFVAETAEDEFGMPPAQRVRVLNPIASQHAVMRSSLLSGLVANLRYNLNRQAERVRSFEIGRAFWRDAGVEDGPQSVAGVAQPRRLALLACGPMAEAQWGRSARKVDFFDLRGEIEDLVAPLGLEIGCSAADPAFEPRLRALHPGRRACIRLAGETIGVIGELHPELCRRHELGEAPQLAELDLDPLLRLELPRSGSVPRFPALVRDLAIWVEAAAPAGAMLADLQALAQREPNLAVVRDLRLFDVFRPSEKTAESDATGLLIKEKSLAFRVVLQDTERSLAEADADSARTTLLQHLEQRWGARSR
jgi:phenylalanyl-tRNA synthetase beta chain